MQQLLLGHDDPDALSDGPGCGAGVELLGPAARPGQSAGQSGGPQLGQVLGGSPLSASRSAASSAGLGDAAGGLADALGGAGGQLVTSGPGSAILVLVQVTSVQAPSLGSARTAAAIRRRERGSYQTAGDLHAAPVGPTTAGMAGGMPMGMMPMAGMAGRRAEMPCNPDWFPDEPRSKTSPKCQRRSPANGAVPGRRRHRKETVAFHPDVEAFLAKAARWAMPSSVSSRPPSTTFGCAAQPPTNPTFCPRSTGTGADRPMDGRHRRPVQSHRKSKASSWLRVAECYAVPVTAALMRRGPRFLMICAPVFGDLDTDLGLG